jgi:crotonobetainyl-CoA:carnitine CoA-transferase CaiB-like acyl-CoA transferase
MFDVMLALLAIPAAQHFAGKTMAVGGKYALNGAYPFYNVYETSDGHYMTLGALEPKFWANFCRAVGREQWIARQFDDGERREALFAEVRALFKARPRGEWIELMRDADCCCEPVLSIGEALAHAQTTAREMLGQVTTASGEPVAQLGPPYKLSDTPPAMRAAAPLLGEHTDELLEAMGVSAPERERLRAAGAIR